VAHECCTGESVSYDVSAVHLSDLVPNKMRNSEPGTFIISTLTEPGTVARLSKARNLFACSNTGIMGSNFTLEMEECLRIFCVRVIMFRMADPSSKSSYQLSKIHIFQIISEIRTDQRV
jgi:hypothetical protein